MGACFPVFTPVQLKSADRPPGDRGVVSLLKGAKLPRKLQSARHVARNFKFSLFLFSVLCSTILHQYEDGRLCMSAPRGVLFVKSFFFLEKHCPTHDEQPRLATVWQQQEVQFGRHFYLCILSELTCQFGCWLQDQGD